MKKILLVSPLPPPIGGITSWTVEYMNKMPEIGCEPIIVNTSVTGKRLENNANISYFDEFKKLLFTRRAIKKALADNEIKALHYNASCFTFGLIRDFAVLWGFFKKANIVYHCHCNLETNVNNAIAKLFFSRICKKVKCVLALNKNSLNFAKSFTKNASIIPNFISQTYVSYPKANSELKNIVFVGRVCKEKGINELLEAAKELKNINFHIVGPDDDKLLENVNDENIFIHGAQDHQNVIDFLKASDALLLPSYTEGFPLVVMEAMACGLPIIATDVGSISDMIGNEGGELTLVKSSSDIIEAVKNLSSQSVRQAMAEYNLKKVENEYLTASVLRKLDNIYNDLNNSKENGR